MADEAASSQITGSVEEKDHVSANATIESMAQGGTESTCNNNGQSSAEGEHEKSLEFADELMRKGDDASKEKDYAEATDCYSRALEIRAAHFGELSPECVIAYYKYGCALLYKAQEEADPLVSVPKKEEESQKNSSNNEPAKSAVSSESSAASVPKSGEEGGTVANNGKEKVNDGKLKDDEEEEEEGEEDESEAEDTAEGDEDESDLDLAWKMLDVARAIVEKNSADTMEKVDILSALAEVALEREDVETSLSDYLKALSILERIVAPDSRHIAELNFRICLCLEIGSRLQEAIPYCEKAISVCKSRVQRLTDEIKSSSDQKESSEHSVAKSSTTSSQDPEAEIETLTGLCNELEKKLEELQQLASNPASFLQGILGMVSAKARGGGEKPSASAAMSSSEFATVNSNGGFDSPTVSTAHTNGSAGVTDLGVVGRGVKRVNLNPTSSESTPAKKPSLAPPSNGDNSAS